jgi:predicted  nucleic acid-binding Zn-ribbon protein
MSPRARTTAPKRSGSSTGRASTAKRGKGQNALDRLTKSVDAAQDALKDLRGEMSKGSSAILKDVDKQLKDARKSLRGSSKSVLKDLEELQQRITSAAPGRGGAKKTSTARKSSATARKAASSGSGTARKAGSTARATASRSSAARKTSSTQSKSAAAPRARAKKS